MKDTTVSKSTPHAPLARLYTITFLLFRAGPSGSALLKPALTSALAQGPQSVDPAVLPFLLAACLVSCVSFHRSRVSVSRTHSNVLSGYFCIWVVSIWGC